MSGPYEMTEVEAFYWLDRLVSNPDLEDMWRVEVNSDYQGPTRYFEVRAYPLEREGWCGGRGETLLAALCWLRGMIEDRRPK